MNYTPGARDKLRIVLNNYEMFGLRQTLRDALAYLLTHSPDPFDDKYGVSTALTSGSVAPLEAGIGDPRSLENGHGYEPTDERSMRHILSYAQARLDLRRFTFIDLGCGKGRAVLMASELPFREVIGVELSPALCEAARQNLASYRPGALRQLSGSKGQAKQRPQLTIQCADVTQFELPRTDLLIYMFNPFRGSVFQTVLERLATFRATQAHDVYVILNNPVMEDMLREHPAFTKTHEFQVIASGNSWNFWRCALDER
jgi:predicted RNA methylase